jgi:HlyD family secretion protein
MNEQIRGVPGAVGLKHGDEQSAVSSIVNLLKLEGEARSVKSVHDLRLLIANDARNLTRSRQIFVLSVFRGNRIKVEAVTSLASVDRNVPLIQFIERTLTRLAADAGITQSREFALHAYADSHDATARTQPMSEALWLPLRNRRGDLFAGILMLRETPWAQDDHVLVKRLVETFEHAWHWHAVSPVIRSNIFDSWRSHSLVMVLLAGLGSIPVSMTTLAPLEVASRQPFLVTAPLDGAIDDIPVAPNSQVHAGQPLVKFSDTSLRNRLAVAEREVQVAHTRVKRTMLVAVSDVQGRHELSIAQAELTVKSAERDFAKELLARTMIIASRSGLAVFRDKRELLGRPVAIGERLMEIVDPLQIELHINVAVSDAIVLHPGARVKVFLDSDPLHPVEATVVQADYLAKLNDGNILSFRAVAEFMDKEQSPARLGTRGTAQLFGTRVPMAYYLFRRPISAVRQWLGL